MPHCRVGIRDHLRKYCPVCGSANLAKVLYGLVHINARLQKDIDDGKVVLGGCCVPGPFEDWLCNDCGMSAEEHELNRIIKKTRSPTPRRQAGSRKKHA